MGRSRRCGGTDSVTHDSSVPPPALCPPPWLCHDHGLWDDRSGRAEGARQTCPALSSSLTLDPLVLTLGGMIPVAARFVDPDLPTVPDDCPFLLKGKARANSARLGNRYINLNALAREMGCSESYLSRVFRLPSRNLSLRMAIRIAKMLRIPVEDLTQLLDEKKKSGNRPLSLI
jgi:AraC-like DNA-binding protein